MAKGFYQIPTIPRLYVSYPAWQYANGALNQVYRMKDYSGGLSYGDLYTQYEESIYNSGDGVYNGINYYHNLKMIQLDPSNAIKIIDEGNNGTMVLGWNVVDRKTYSDWSAFEDTGDTSSYTGDLPPKLWNFNYVMILNHNLASAGAYYKFRQIRGVSSWSEWSPGGSYFSVDPIVNNSGNDVIVEYDGFSVNKITNALDSNSYLGMGLLLGTPDGSPFNTDIEIGSVLWGKYFDFPQNCDLNMSLSYEYDKKNITNITGQTISKGKWNKIDGWYNTTNPREYGDVDYPDNTLGNLGGSIFNGGAEPFGLRKPYSDAHTDHDTTQIHDLHDSSSSHRRKSGLRVWNISFDSLAPEYLMNQNIMMNSNAWSNQGWYFDNYDVDSDGTTSTYNIDSGMDFYTNVVHRTNGGSLPMVMQINKDDNSPQNFVIVKMSDYTITQKNDNLYNISLVLEEQV